MFRGLLALMATSSIEDRNLPPFVNPATLIMKHM